MTFSSLLHVYVYESDVNNQWSDYNLIYGVALTGSLNTNKKQIKK